MNLFSEDRLSVAGARTSVPSTSHSVLIVDDEVGNLRVLRAMLGQRFRVLEAHNGSEALELISGLAPGESPALVLSDQRMPKMTGVELFERVRVILPEAMRIIVTGFVDVSAIVDSINRAGIFRFVVKPFDQQQLWRELERALELYEIRRRSAGELARLQRDLEARTREACDLRQQLQAARAGST